MRLAAVLALAGSCAVPHTAAHHASRSRLDLAPLEQRIGGCESAGRPDAPIRWRAHNPTSTASGGFQFLDSTWWDTTHLAPPASAYSPSVQLHAFRLLRSRAGLRPWAASRPCWETP